MAPAPGFELPKGFRWCDEKCCDDPERKGKGAAAQIRCVTDKCCTDFNSKCQCYLFHRKQVGADEDKPPWEPYGDPGKWQPVEDNMDYSCACVMKDEKKKRTTRSTSSSKRLLTKTGAAIKKKKKRTG